MPRHSHAPAYFSLLLQGGYTERDDRQSRTCQPSALILHPPGSEHAVQFHNARVRIFRVEVKPPWLERVREQATVLDRPAEFQGGWPARLAARLYHEFREMDDAASPLAIEGIALEILAEAARRQHRAFERQPPRWLGRVRELLHAQFPEPLTLARVAEAAGVHPVHLAREFRRHYRCTVGEYVRRLRVERACREIAKSDVPLVEIASAAGFYDQSHFSRTFKRLTGLTPAAFRAACRGR
jgi:AraC family transcriptional regulator